MIIGQQGDASFCRSLSFIRTNRLPIRFACRSITFPKLARETGHDRACRSARMLTNSSPVTIGFRKYLMIYEMFWRQAQKTSSCRASIAGGDCEAVLMEGSFNRSARRLNWCSGSGAGRIACSGAARSSLTKTSNAALCPRVVGARRRLVLVVPGGARITLITSRASAQLRLRFAHEATSN